MNATGRNTAMSDSVVARTARPMSRVASAGGDERLLLLHLDEPDDVLEHDDGVVDDDADREREREQRDDVEREAHRPHQRERADDGDGDRERRDERAAGVSEEDEDDERRENGAEHEVLLHRVDARPDRPRLVADDARARPGRQRLLDADQPRAHRVDDRDRVLARLLADRQHHALACRPPTAAVVGSSDAVLHPRDVLDAGRVVQRVPDDDAADLLDRRRRAPRPGARGSSAPSRSARRGRVRFCCASARSTSMAVSPVACSLSGSSQTFI